MMDQSYWKEQLYKYRTRSLTSEEEESLFEALADPANAEGWKEIIGEMFLEQVPGEDYQTGDWEPVLQAVFNSDRAAQPAAVRQTPIIRRFFVAAAVACGLLIGGYWLFTKFGKDEKPGVAGISHPADIAAPASSRASITLAGGGLVYLDSADNGALARQGNAQLVKVGSGQVAYQLQNSTDQPLLFNTLTNPRGSLVVNLTLSDGTRVWLNSESTLRYPVVFGARDRTVELSGEGYFEVKKNADQPFVVDVKNGAKIEVLGTAFNVNGYPDEPGIQATLLEGSVRVSITAPAGVRGMTSSDQPGVLLKPGQQAQLARAEKLSILDKVDTAAVMAWKNGLFAFHDADLPTVMRQLARWYNIDVSYTGEIPQGKYQFNGKMGKDLSLNSVLDLLTNAQVHYTIEPGNKLVIRP